MTRTSCCLLSSQACPFAQSIKTGPNGENGAARGLSLPLAPEGQMCHISHTLQSTFTARMLLPFCGFLQKCSSLIGTESDSCFLADRHQHLPLGCLPYLSSPCPPPFSHTGPPVCFPEKPNLFPSCLLLVLPGMFCAALFLAGSLSSSFFLEAYPSLPIKQSSPGTLDLVLWDTFILRISHLCLWSVSSMKPRAVCIRSRPH